MFCLIASFLVPSNIYSAESERIKRVLMISTGTRFSPGFALVDQGVLEALGKLESGKAEVYGENLDIVRFPSERFGRIFSDYLMEKYAEQPPDLIILIYVGNLSIAGKLLQQLFPGTPVIVAGHTEEEIRTGQFGPLVSGLAQRVNPRASLELIQRLQPETQRIVVIGGTAEVDKIVLNRVKEAVHLLPERVKVDFWENRSVAELRQAVSSLPPHNAILFTRMFQDAAGQPVISGQAGQLIAQWANAPVYIMTDVSLGTGAVGGSVASVEAMGKRAGELARLILSGTAPASLPFEIRSDSVATFDWRALKRWGIPESRLPPNSIVRFKPASLWDEYRWYIIGALIVICVQGAMIADLLLQRARRRRVEADLVENRQFMELATEAGGIGLWVRDMVSGNVWANPRLRSLLGLGQADVLSADDVLARVHPDDRARVMSVIQRAEETAIPFDLEFRTAIPDRPERWFAVRGKFMRGPRGQLLGRMGTMIDITGRKLAEQQVFESEENFRRLVENTSAVIWQADIDTWVFRYVGPQAVKLLGYPLEKWYEKDFWISHIHPDDREWAVNTCVTMSKSAQEFDFEHRMIGASGEIVWLHNIVSCGYQDGKRTQLRGLMIDITERKGIEHAILESEERFRMMANTAPVMIWMSGTDKLCTFFNKGWLDFTGHTMEHELGNGWTDGVYRDDLDHCLEVYCSAFDARQEFSMEYRLRRYDGEYCWILDTGVPRFAPDGSFLGYIGSAIDITERKRVAEALRQSEEHYRTLAETAADVIITMDQNSTILFVNVAVEKVLGYVPDELIGQKITLLIPEPLRQRHLEGMRRYLETGEKLLSWGAVSFPGLHKSGREISLEITFAESGRDDNRIFTGIIRDITERKRAEAEARQQRDELAHLTRVSTMGELAASLAHELNQPLTAILSNAQAAQRFLSANRADIEEVREILHDIVEDNNRAGEIIRRMRALVKKEELEFSSLVLASIVREIVLLVHSDAVLRNVRVSLDVRPDLPYARGDKVQLQQVMLNLLLNAFDAMKDCPVEEREVIVQAASDGAGMVRISIRDYGTGLTSDKLEKIFQPFYTTKREGLGMGLSISRSIVEAHGGRLWAENNAAHGATFYFTLPVAGVVVEQKEDPTGPRGWLAASK